MTCHTSVQLDNWSVVEQEVSSESATNHRSGVGRGASVTDPRGPTFPSSRPTHASTAPIKYVLYLSSKRKDGMAVSARPRPRNGP